MSQGMFMSSSSRIYDGMFDLAHLLKLVSYFCVLIGLLINMYHLFVLSAKEALLVHDIDTGAFIDVNQRICDILGYSRSEMLKLSLPALSLDKPPYSQSDLALFLRNASSTGRAEPRAAASSGSSCRWRLTRMADKPRSYQRHGTSRSTGASGRCCVRARGNTATSSSTRSTPS